MKHRWIWAWVLQLVEMLALGLAAAFSLLVGPLPEGIMLWGIVPLSGMLTSCKAVRRGLLNYAAWLLPAPCLYAAYMLVWGYTPPVGPSLLTAFLSLAGAAAGEELKRRVPKKRRS